MRVVSDGQERALAAPTCACELGHPPGWGSAAGLSQLRVNPPGTPLAASICPTGVQKPAETMLLWQVFTTLQTCPVFVLNSVNGKNRSNSVIIIQPPLLSTYPRHIVAPCCLFLTGFGVCCYSEKKLLTSLGKLSLRVGEARSRRREWSSELWAQVGGLSPTVQWIA